MLPATAISTQEMLRPVLSIMRPSSGEAGADTRYTRPERSEGSNKKCTKNLYLRFNISLGIRKFPPEKQKTHKLCDKHRKF
jgi:hypothetical protein